MGGGFDSRGSDSTPAAKRRAAYDRLNDAIASCERCPRLRRYCLRVAEEKRRAYRGWSYWGRPVPNFGDPEARLLIVGLAPAAHGANRTGRMFTGDRSGDFLYRALHSAGYSSSPTAVRRYDGLTLSDCAITAIIHCAPPGNKPEGGEIQNCSGWLEETFALVPFRVLLVLGQVAWRTVSDLAARKGWLEGRSPKFSHGAAVRLNAADGRMRDEAEAAVRLRGRARAWGRNGAPRASGLDLGGASSRLGGERLLAASYHPSQRNTFTGRLTEAMLDEVFVHVREFLDG